MHYALRLRLDSGTGLHCRSIDFVLEPKKKSSGYPIAIVKGEACQRCSKRQQHQHFCTWQRARTVPAPQPFNLPEAATFPPTQRPASIRCVAQKAVVVWAETWLAAFWNVDDSFAV
jgi:hypothetical protein